MAVVVSKCNNIINYQNCSANIGINLRNSYTCTYSSGSSNKIPVEVVVEIVVIIKYMQ